MRAMVMVMAVAALVAVSKAVVERVQVREVLVVEEAGALELLAQVVEVAEDLELLAQVAVVVLAPVALAEGGVKVTVVGEELAAEA